MVVRGTVLTADNPRSRHVGPFIQNLGRGQHQPEAAGMLRETEPPAFVAIVGKPRTYETDDGTVNVSLRPEHLTIVDEATRNRWVTETAERTLERIDRFGGEANEYAQMAREQYGDTVEQYRQAIIEAVESLDAAPNNTSVDTASALSDSDEATPDAESDPTTPTADTSTAGDHAPTEQDASADPDENLDDFDADEFDSET